MTTNEGMNGLLDADEVRSVLADEFYGASERRPRPRRRLRTKPASAEHYKVICISLYNEDLARLDDKVEQLKASGHRKMSRSALIRFALDQVDLAALPKSY
ncbi:MAG: hypothetical protein GXP55_20540 [Deltaproteobacteria bacterium]|nr:hypothetical protein [Deltaproteobacteria bacterium]